jgi:phage terminase small subunit
MQIEPDHILLLPYYRPIAGLPVLDLPFGLLNRIFATMIRPLKNARHEAFAQAVANGHKLCTAYERAGYSGKDPKLSWKLRHRREIDARISWLLEMRVKSDTRAHRRREKRDDDLRQQVIDELKKIAFADVRNVASWRREAQMSPDGEFIAVADRLIVTESARLSSDAAAAIKGVFTKAGQVRIELHDKQTALATLAKIVGLFEEPSTPSQSTTTINQVNIGDVNTLDAARKVAFLIRQAAAMTKPSLPIIEGTKVDLPIEGNGPIVQAPDLSGKPDGD